MNIAEMRGDYDRDFSEKYIIGTLTVLSQCSSLRHSRTDHGDQTRSRAQLQLSD